ncbi:hypothetical protein BX666DRAFT_1929075, partial [Dichotomocladium elegans]
MLFPPLGITSRLLLSSRTTVPRKAHLIYLQSRPAMTVVAAANAKDIRPSATLIVAAPQDAGDFNYKVLLMKRNAKSSFINAHVFPGGVVDKHDDSKLWESLLKMPPTDELTYKICAIRETFEESGLLLTHPSSQVLRDKDGWREKVHQDASQFKVLCETHGLLPAVDRLEPFANWITPVAERRRFNTHFFLTVWTPDSPAEADGKEMVMLNWLSPAQALELWHENEILLFPPQWYCLHTMEDVKRHDQLIARAGIGSLRSRCGGVSTVMPQHNMVDDPARMDEGYHTFLAYPGDETYLDLQTGEPTGNPGDRHRIYVRGKMEHFMLEKNVDVSGSTLVSKANL